LRVLITNNTLQARAGSEVYAKEVAIGLLRRGHTPIAYSTRLGTVADELRRATVPVVDDLNSVSIAPDIIHGQHHLETMTALLHFPGVPAVYFCLGWLQWEEKPPRFPRIKHYVAVDDVCRDRLVLQEGIPAHQVSIIGNSIDLDRFKTRPPLPQQPRRALVYSNYAEEDFRLRTIRKACAGFGIEVDVVGSGNGNQSVAPEELLGDYDIVFAKARCAFEAMATGAAVIVCDYAGVGPMVTTGELDRLKGMNFGLRALCNDFDSRIIADELARYDPRDAAEVSRRIRDSSGAEMAIDEMVTLYERVLAENRDSQGSEPEVEARATAEYLRSHLRREEQAIYSSESYRLGNFLVRTPVGRLIKRYSKGRR
jgi:hypothetical protein